MQDGEIYELAGRAVVALESIAWSLIKIEENLRPHVQTGEQHPLNKIPGLDDLGGKVDGFTSCGNVLDHKLSVDSSDQESTEVDAAALAREAEELLNAAATPEVKTSVEIGEGEKPTKPLNRINLFAQATKSLEELWIQKRDDEILKKAMEVSTAAATNSAELSYPERVLIAAVELVYTHLPLDMWGSEVAQEQIKLFMAQHSEEQ